MAESSGEKTEMPTPKKLRDAREKGQVCTSKDIVSTAILIVLFAVLAWMGAALLVETQQLIATIGGRLADPANGAVSACSVTTATGVGSGVSTGAEVPCTAIVTVPAR